MDHWLTIKQLSGRLNIPVKTLRDWRYQGHGPQGTKLRPGRGGQVRYKLSEIERWERAQEAADPARRASA